MVNKNISLSVMCPSYSINQSNYRTMCFSIIAVGLININFMRLIKIRYKIFIFGL